MKHFGYIPSSVQSLDRVYDHLTTLQGSPEFCDVAPHLKGFGAGKLSLNFKSVLKLCPAAFTDDAQKTGDCTSHGSRNAADCARAVEIDLKGESEEWVARGATEGIYAYRGWAGEGMSPADATEFLSKKGGVLLRQKYPFADLSKYNPDFGIKLGGKQYPQEVMDEAHKHPCQYWAKINSVEEARDALAAGYGIHCGSGLGFSNKRDAKGFARVEGSWGHDMCWAGCDDTNGEISILIVNSWGVWNSGGEPDWGPIPGGSFLIHADTANRMIREGECWAVGNVQGWPARDLPDYGTKEFLG